MRLIPHSGREWGALFLLPFKTFIVVAAPSLYILCPMLPRHADITEAASGIFLGYFFAGGILVLVGFGELFDKQTREAGIVNLVFGGMGILVGFMIAPMLATA